MPKSLAEAYMLILRPVPVVGEAVAPPFYGQIYIDEWNWKLQPGSAQRALGQAGTLAQEGAAAPQHRTGDPPAPGRPQLRSADLPTFDAAALIDDVRRMQTNRSYSQAARDRRIREMIERAATQHQAAQSAALSRQRSGSDDASGSGADADSSSTSDSSQALTFTFSKNTDFATTQMLYSMANNHLIPTVILTVFQRSNRVPVTLIVTMGNVRFSSYKISCDSSNETMSEMMETWDATYESIDYAYQNRPPIGLKTSVFNAATQGRVKVFAMKPRGGGGLF